MSDTATPTEARPGRPRVAAVVGLTLLEVIRRQDLPTEILEDEDPSITMPRRLGLSEVVERQIHTYRESVRKRRRISDREIADLFRLVIRRPDAEEVFFRAGRILSDEAKPAGWRRILPRALAFALARRRTTARLKALFGRRVGGFGRAPFTMEGRSHIFIEADPGGAACQFLSGLCETIVQAYTGSDARIVHARCRSRGDDMCRWTVLAEDSAGEQARDLAWRPEPGTS